MDSSASLGVFVLFLIITVVIIVVVIKHVRKENSEAEKNRQEDEFKDWLTSVGFVCKIAYGNFLYDSVHNKWCKFGVRHVFSASETGSARTNTIKHKGSADTYEVIIETKIAALPVVRIYCGTKYRAQDIKATINIIKSSQK